MREQLQLLPGYLSAHLALTLTALFIGVLVSVPLGVAVTRVRRWEPVVLGAASVVQTVPSLALLAFMVPLLAAVGAQSIGFLPALVGLCLYSVLPILRNTVTGLLGVDPSLLEAADGVGMTSRQRLFRVELPLALPVTVAGLRTAAVWTVGTATLSTPVGAPSLGNYIFSGLQTRNYGSVLVGCIASAVLALTLDGIVLLAEVGIRRRRRLLWGGALAALVALALWPIGRSVQAYREHGAVPVRIGAKTFTEQYILSRILAGTITSATGQPTRLVDSLGSTVAFDALRTGAIDVYVDYSGTLWATVLRRSGPTAGRAAVLDEVRRGLHDRFGIELIAPLGFENTYALAMRRIDAARRGITTISQLTPIGRELTAGGDYEFFQRPEWHAIERTYGLAFREQRPMDPALMYEATRGGAVDVISAFSTDGRIASYGLQVLADDRGVIPPYDAVVLVSSRLARERPAVVDALRTLSGRIDASRMRAMNADVDAHGRSPAEVAQRFLQATP